MGEQAGLRVIKRYANRKLYDMRESCYITHDEIAALVRSGEEIKIIDNRTKEDLTTATLTQILFDKERRTKKSLPLDTLRNLFKEGGEFIQRHIAQPVSNLKDEAEKNVRKVFRPRAGDKAYELEVPDLDEADLAIDLSGRGSGKASEAVREWVAGTQQAYESLQRSVEERWGIIMSQLGQFDRSHRRVEALEQRVEALEALVATLTAKRSEG